MRSPFHIDVLLTETHLADQFVAALARRFLPEAFFYWSPLSVRAWLALCRDGPYRNYVRSETLLRSSIPKILDLLPGEQITVISLGAGHGTKDVHILAALTEGKRHATYIPVDASQALLEMACANAEGYGVNHRGVKADLTDAAHLSALIPDAHAPPRVVLMIGNTLGAFDPPGMLHALRPLLRPQDLLVVDGELGLDEDTRAGYENPTNRAFALAPLQSVGLTETDGMLVFEAQANARPGLHRLTKYFRVETDLSLRVGGEPLCFQAGERITMSHSGKYEHTAFQQMIEGAGFELAAEWLSDDRRFVLVLARPRPSGTGVR